MRGELWKMSCLSLRSHCSEDQFKAGRDFGEGRDVDVCALLWVWRGKRCTRPIGRAFWEREAMHPSIIDPYLYLSIALQRQTVVTAYLSSKQLPLWAFARLSRTADCSLSHPCPCPCQGHFAFISHIFRSGFRSFLFCELHAALLFVLTYTSILKVHKSHISNLRTPPLE